MDVQEKIFSDRVSLLNRNLLLGVPSNILCTIITFYGLYLWVGHPKLFLWAMISFTCIGVHILIALLNHSFHFNIHWYSKFLVLLALIYGSLWGIAGPVFIPHEDPLHQMFLLCIIVGVASAGVHLMQVNFFTSSVFLMTSLLPLSCYFLTQENLDYLLLGGALLMYFLFMLMMSWIGHRMFNNNFNLHYENLHLIDQLSISNTILEESESRFRSAFNYAAIGMGIVSLEGHWLKVNKVLCEIVGYSEEELLKIDFQRITYPEDLQKDLNYVRMLLEGQISSYHMEKRYIHKNGSIIWILLSGSLIRDHKNQPLYFIAQIQNIDAQKKAEEELKFIAFHDVLTGLANRKQLEISFNYVLAFAKRHQTQLAVLFLDVDHFKEINDNFGHRIGDLVLIEIAQRLKCTLRANDISVRLAGDEFIFILTEITDSDIIVNIAKKFLNIIAEPMTFNQRIILTTVSIGISVYPQDGEDLNILLKKADDALYQVKSEGRNNFKIYGV